LSTKENSFGCQVNMDLIKIEPNTDGEIQPTFVLTEVKDEQNCFTILKTEGLVSVFQILSQLPHGIRSYCTDIGYNISYC
jgi:hypothetical protein